MPIGDTAGLLFKIKADGGQAETELKKIAAETLGLGKGFESLSGPAGIATAAVLAVGAAAVTAAAALFNFTKQAAEFGSQLYDASIKTGLSAEAISALKLAADSAGSSLDAISGTVSKFNVLIGQARQGNEKAEATLKQYGITSRDTTIALDQAITKIAAMTTADQKAAAAKDLFKDKTGQILPIIDQVNGRLIAFIENARKLGATLTKEDLKASDDFGDSLEVLGAQAKIAGVKFASELMPMCIQAMNAISKVLADNQGVAREWGNTIVYICTSVRNAFVLTGNLINFELNVITGGLYGQQTAWQQWAAVARIAIYSVFGGLIAMANAINTINGALGSSGGSTGKPPDKMRGTTSAHSTIPGGYQTPQIKIPSMGGGGGGGGGGGRGGGGGANDAEQKRQKAVRDAEHQANDELAIFKKLNDEKEAELDRSLAKREISEMEHIQRTNALELAALNEEKRLQQGLLDSPKLKLSGEDKAEILQKIKVLTIEIRTETLKGGTEEIKQNAELNEKLAEIIKKEKERLKVLKEQKQIRDAEYLQQRNAERQARDPYGVGSKKKGANGDIDWDVSSSGDLLTGIVDSLGAAKDQMPAMQQLGGMLVQTFGQVAQAVGQAVKSFILFGSAGGSFKKFAVEVIASLAQMAVVQAIFEAAQGLAMLALSWFTGNPKYAKSAAGHFAAAAVFGMVGGVATVAGRAMAGNSFNEATGGSATGSGGEAAGDNAPLNFTSGGFSGFQRQQNQRQNEVLGYLAETIDTFNSKYNKASPGAIVRDGASDAAEHIAGAVNEYHSDNPRAADGLKRASGNYS